MLIYLYRTRAWNYSPFGRVIRDCPDFPVKIEFLEFAKFHKQDVVIEIG